ncbi:FMN-binding negative transcriptional regulator [Shewanella livingstonensis]|uniref:FMN-binding negative transcriptional regulator n=1 Tax=Shewanella livingstonensis TaxID=150120 RepID=A0A3G8LUD2_9GAMM|nr:FMN-binding negative transcriptional regulator [Shewanella livingstonensis]AZG72350.1 FMN-binding negative transcriptional regulator [Shewanella livingstonensis]
MHVPDKWDMSAQLFIHQFIHQFIQQYGFAAVITDDLDCSHLPLLLAPLEGQHGTLYGHFARTNPHWKQAEGATVLCIFNGPHAYISPTWYDSQPAVPTWNYSVVHAKGRLELLDDATTVQVLESTIEQYEPSLLDNGGFIPQGYQDKLAKGIVGFKIVIDELQGKQKLGQHRHQRDQQGVAQGLSQSTRTDEKQLLDYMVRHNIGLGNQ